jgi:RNA polymerase sigma-70 factor, ECF subfamily
MLTPQIDSAAIAYDELALVAAVGAGDVDAFERLYRLYERRVFQYILGFVRDRTLAEEVSADTLLAVWRSANSFGGSSRVSTWILGIARHKALDAARRQLRVSSSTNLEEAGDLPSTTPGPMDATEERSLARLTRSAFEHLSEEHREVLYLAFYEEVPYEEIAALLDVPHNTVKTRVYYAKRKLRERLEELSIRGEAL